MKESKEWVKPFETKESVRKIANIEFGFIESKDDYCHVHKTDYTNECHLLPSGKITWYGCPTCQDERNKQIIRVHIEKPKPSEIQEIYQQPIKKAKGF